MGLRRTKILVVDDSPEEGQKIVEAIWKNGFPALFVEYDPPSLVDGIYGTHQGVRVIFMDINLDGGGIEGSSSHLFAPAENALRTLLDEKNGPYALITWSSYASKSEDLYKHLQDRLPEGKRPVSHASMNKEDLLSGASSASISDVVKSNLEKQDSVRALAEWEGNVKNSASSVISSLAAIVESSDEKFESNLECLLWKLASAEAGKWLHSGDDLSPSLYGVLSPLLSDRLSYVSPEEYSISSTPCETIPSDLPESWAGAMNSWLHIDYSISQTSIPGSLFSYPVNCDELNIPLLKNAKDVKTCIRSHFLDFDSKVDGYRNRKTISGECELLLMDITPPCDHSNKKVDWRRFMTVCKVPFQHVECLWLIDRRQGERVPGKLKGEFLKMSPKFKNNGEEFVLVFNANLMGGIAEQSDWSSLLGDSVLRVREQLLRDIIGWMGGHITRNGIVAVH